MYLKICFTTCMSIEEGDCMYWQIRLIAYVRSNLMVVQYCKAPTIFWLEWTSNDVE